MTILIYKRDLYVDCQGCLNKAHIDNSSYLRSSSREFLEWGWSSGYRVQAARARVLCCLGEKWFGFHAFGFKSSIKACELTHQGPCW